MKQKKIKLELTKKELHNLHEATSVLLDHDSNTKDPRFMKRLVLTHKVYKKILNAQYQAGVPKEKQKYFIVTASPRMGSGYMHVYYAVRAINWEQAKNKVMKYSKLTEKEILVIAMTTQQMIKESKEHINVSLIK